MSKSDEQNNSDNGHPSLYFPFVQEENRLSMAMENYLHSILRLRERSVKVTVANLAEHFKNLPSSEGLGTSIPSVSAMIRRLSREKLVQINATKEIDFTTLGLQLANGIVRRHRLAERLVVDLLGVDLKYAYSEAHRLEHAISPYLEHRIIEILKHPTRCPFGHPIPGTNYVADENLVTLNLAISDRGYIIDRIPEDDVELLDYFVKNDFLPGSEIIIKDNSESRGVITISVKGKDIFLSMEVSQLIWICPN